MQSLSKVHPVALLVPAALVVYFFVGFVGTYETVTDGDFLETCRRSYDYGSFVGAALGVLTAGFVWRLAQRPTTPAQETAAPAHKVIAGLLVVIALGLLLDGLGSEGLVPSTFC